MSFYVSTATFYLLHCDEWDRVVALPRHKFVTGATLLQLIKIINKIYENFNKKIKNKKSHNVGTVPKSNFKKPQKQRQTCCPSSTCIHDSSLSRFGTGTGTIIKSGMLK